MTEIWRKVLITGQECPCKQTVNVKCNVDNQPLQRLLTVHVIFHSLPLPTTSTKKRKLSTNQMPIKINFQEKFEPKVSKVPITQRGALWTPPLTSAPLQFLLPVQLTA